MMPCPACDGTGLDSNHQPCPACGGEAEVVLVKSDVFARSNGAFDWIVSLPIWEETASGTSPTIERAYADISTQLMQWAKAHDTAIAGAITVVTPHFDAEKYEKKPD